MLIDPNEPFGNGEVDHECDSDFAAHEECVDRDPNYGYVDFTKASDS